MADTQDTLRRARFIQEYVKDLNGQEAALRAGYSPKSAKVTACRLLKRPEVRDGVERLLAKLARSNEVTVERTLREIARIAYGDTRKLFREDGSLMPLHEMDDEAAALVASVETETRREGSGEDAEYCTIRKIKRWDKVRALEQCMAYLGMHKSRTPGEGGGGLSLTINLSTGKRAA